MNYVIEIGHAMQSSIVGTDEAIDNELVFSSFTKAKAEYIKRCMGRKSQWQENINAARKLKKDNVLHFLHNTQSK